MASPTRPGELQDATEGLSGAAYRAALIKRLREIAEELRHNPGTIRPGGGWWN